MSHFSVAVLSESPEEVGALLAPYDEDLEVEPYREYLDPEGSDKYCFDAWRKEFGTDDPERLVTLVESDYFGTPLLLDEDGVRLYYMTTLNPKRKWDWYEIGGRFSGMLLAKPNYQGPSTLGRPGVFDNDPYYSSGTDQLPLAAVDWDAMKAARLRRGEEQYRDLQTKYRRLVADRGEEAALQRLNFDWWENTETIKSWLADREVFLARYTAPLQVYAVVTRDGEWHARARMGWFGVSLDEEGTEEQWRTTALNLIQNSPEDPWLTICDLHI